MRHFIDLFDVTPEEIQRLYAEAARLKAEHGAAQLRPPLAGRVLGLVFEKPSLRTRVSFQAAIGQLGGTSVYLSGVESGLGTREPVADFARVMTQYVDAVVLRTFDHGTVEEFARVAHCPVINGLSNEHHPCQALADLFTVREAFAGLDGRTLAFIGDGNNMARSLAVICAHLGVRFLLAAPDGYELDGPFLDRFRQRFPKIDPPRSRPLDDVVPEADVLYTDVWTSMGQEKEQAHRAKAFAGYQVNAKLLAKASPNAVVMHCLPAHRGEEITEDVITSPQSVIFRQAGNRLHVQKALLLWLLHG
jgi:ornithine carbamoyltransferase